LAACFEITVATPALAPYRVDLPAIVFFPEQLGPLRLERPLKRGPMIASNDMLTTRSYWEHYARSLSGASPANISGKVVSGR
jgi:hypothetical protein